MASTRQQTAAKKVSRGAVKAARKAAATIVEKGRDLTADRDVLHVDLVKNEWLAGYQVVVARIKLKDGVLQVDASDPSWTEIALRPLGELDPATDPEGFITAMPEGIHGSYLFATEPHDDASCPYHDGLVVPMRATGVTRDLHAI
jgi:hypothetical protein